MFNKPPLTINNKFDREALRPILAYYNSSSKKGFWLKSDETKGEYIDFAHKKSGSYDVERCLTISPHAGVSHVNCRKSHDDVADVVCEIPLRK